MSVSPTFDLVALTSTPSAIEWLQTVGEARILHLFDRSCNLVAGNGSILSLVTPEIGPGPSSMVVAPADDSNEALVSFSEQLDAKALVKISSGKLVVGPLVVDTGRSSLWQPIPAWERLSGKDLPIEAEVKEALSLAASVNGQPSMFRHGRWAGRYRLAAIKGWSSLSWGFLTEDIAFCLQGARYLSGLGPGLTPAGDDFLVGIMYALWASRPAAEVRPVTAAIANAAGMRTTRLSANWLSAASRGEAGLPWHQLVDGLASGDGTAVNDAVASILEIGHTSGADALSGFLLAVTALSVTERL